MMIDDKCFDNGTMHSRKKLTTHTQTMLSRIPKPLKILEDLRKSHLEWEAEMVLSFKIDPKEVNKRILKHPVVIQRNLMYGPIRKEKKILRPILPNLLKNINKFYGVAIRSETRDLGYDFHELQFGESTVYDFCKHKNEYNKLLSCRRKAIGLHMPRSTRQYKMVGHGTEITKNMELKTFEDSRAFHNLCNTLIYQPFRSSL